MTTMILALTSIAAGLSLMGYNVYQLWQGTDAQKRKRALLDAESRVNEFRYLQP